MIESDLLAAEARYHHVCKTNFLQNFNVSKNEPEDPDTMSENNKDVEFRWTTAWVQGEWWDYHHAEKKHLIQKIKEYFKDAIIVLSLTGIASIVAFTSEPTKLFHLMKQDDDDDEVDMALSKVAKKIQQEIGMLKRERNKYRVNIDVDIAREPISETLLSLLEKVSWKFSHSLPGLLIGNMISGMVQKSPTDLQISLGVAMWRNKSMITLLHNFGMCCSYDEVTLFKHSAAVAVAEDIEEVKLSGKNLIHCCADNFD